MKYIIFDMIKGIGDCPIIFPTCLTHADIANAFRGHQNVLSAGFVSINVDCNGVTVECHGAATSLPGKCSRPEEDSAIIARTLKKY